MHTKTVPTNEASLWISSLLTDSNAPLFWNAELIDQPSAWFGHIPFAHWIVAVIRPSVLVELGTHAGVSYTSFCRAVEKENIGTRCFAVDTWKGDTQAGLYSEDIYLQLKKHNQERFENFSTLLRSTFDEAAEKFEDGTIDLLHIDGFHSYEAVEHDFKTWQSKLSKRAVVLFHDTNEYKTGFGVWRFWAELKKQYPNFEFLHSHGLGVLLYGEEAPQTIRALCELEESQVVQVRHRFQFAGDRWLSAAQLAQLRGKFDTKITHAKAETNRVTDELKSEVARFEGMAARALTAEKQATELEATLETTQATIGDLASIIEQLQETNNALISSRSWRLTRPLRTANALLAKPNLLLSKTILPLRRRLSQWRQYRMVQQSGLFVSTWYFEQYPDVRTAGIDALNHYLKIGWREGRNPSPDFDTRSYLNDHPDVARRDINPLVHYVLQGIMEHRQVRKPTRLGFDQSNSQDWINELRLKVPREQLEQEGTLVSIILPTRDRITLLPKAIDSVLAQTYENWELLIVDDGSTDGTAHMLSRKYSDKRLRVLESHGKGVGAARNKGLDEAKGSIIAYLDSDNVWVPEYLSLMLMELKRSGASSVYSAIQIHDMGIDNNDEGVWHRCSEFSYDQLCHSNYIDLNIFIHRADLYREHGGFDVNLKRMVDWELILRYTKWDSISYANFVGAHYDNRSSEDRISTREHVAWQNVIRNRYKIDWDDQLRTLPDRENDLVSIVICVYGLIDVTEACLNSLFTHEAGEPFEVILVNNGSDPETARRLDEWAQRHNNITVVHNPENYNFALGCNVGFAQSRGSRIVFLNNDTEVSPEWLRSLVRPLNDPNVKGTQPKLLYPDGTIQNVGIVFPKNSPMGYPIYVGRDGDLQYTNSPRKFRAITAACAAFRAEDFVKVRGFDPIFVNGQEDVDICLRIGHTKPVFQYVADSIVFHHESKTPGRSHNIESNRAKFLERWQDADLTDDEQYYAEDGVVVGDYQADNPAWSKKGYAVWRPFSVSISNQDATKLWAYPILSERTIAIKIGCPRPAIKDHWGDYHFAVSLVAAFMRRGIRARIDFLESWRTNETLADINLVLRGLSKFEPVQDGLNFMWLISHPDKVSIDELRTYNHIFVASNVWGDENLAPHGISFEPLLQCTDSSRFYPRPVEPDIRSGNLFVANSRLTERTIVRDAKLENLELEIFGEMWEKIAPREWIKGQKIENVDLPRFYSNADVVLNDHWETMRQNGFVSNRIFDVLACAAPLVTDDVRGFPEDIAKHCSFFGEEHTLSAAISAARKTGQDANATSRELVADYIRKHHSFDARAAKILEEIQRSL